MLYTFFQVLSSDFTAAYIVRPHLCKNGLTEDREEKYQWLSMDATITGN